MKKNNNNFSLFPLTQRIGKECFTVVSIASLICLVGTNVAQANTTIADINDDLQQFQEEKFISEFKGDYNSSSPLPFQRGIKGRLRGAETTLIAQEENPTTENIPVSPQESPTENIPLSTDNEVNPQEGPKVKIVTPQNEEFLTGISSSVIVQSPLGATVDLLVNGKLVDSSLIGRIEEDSENQVLIQTWYGVIFKEGKNTITARANLNGVYGPETSITINVPGLPAKLEIKTVESRIPADGRSSATINGRFIDKNGGTSKWNATVTLFTSSGEFIGADANPNLEGFQVKSIDGEFSAQLKSGLDAEKVRISAISNGGEYQGFTQMLFSTQLRDDPILTGYIDLRLGARGTNYHDIYQNYLPRDEDNSLEFDVTSAVFATGSLGEWKYTAAFNSDRSINKDCDCDNRLFGTYQSSEYDYPTYGDNSSIEKIAPSTDQLYLRLERSPQIKNADPDYVMWGDYRTEEFSTPNQEFSAVSRSLHGAKFNYNLGNLQLSGLFANQVDGFQRDSIAPDGTSGLYFLSRRLLKSGSEEVYIELEELNRPGTVIERTLLRRDADYEIDYDRGSLQFRQPILRTSTDRQGNVLIRKIVTTYEYESPGNDNTIFAGRARYHFNREPDRETWLGATYWQEDKEDHDFILYGFDTQISIGKDFRLIGEYAHSENSVEFNGYVKGDAYRFEAEADIGNNIRARAYYKTADAGFSNDATVSFVPGQTRYGANITAKVSKNTALSLKYDREDNFGVVPRPLDKIEEFLDPTTSFIPGSEVDNSLTTLSADIDQKIGKANLDLDFIWRSRQDRMSPGNLNSESGQLRTRIDYPITKNLTVKAINETTIIADADTVFSDRTGIGLDWKIADWVTLGVEQQWFTRGPLEGQSLTRVNLDTNYKLGSDTRFKGRYSFENSESGLLGRGAIGLEQDWKIAPGLKMKFAYERVFTNNFGYTGSGKPFQQPYAVGQGASALQLTNGNSYSVGLNYTDNPDFSASIRFEHRDSSKSSNTVLTANANGKITPSLQGLFSYQQSDVANQGLEDLGTSRELKVGLAYRNPNDDRFNGLLKYEFRQNPNTIPDTILFGIGTGSEDHLLSLEGIYTPNWRWEFYGKYAFRSSTTYLADDFVANSEIHLGQLRASYRLGYNWDVVAEARMISQPSAGYTETGFLAELGYYLTSELRLYAGYGFGKVDDADFTGTRSAGGPYIGVTVKLNGLWDGFGEQKPVPPQQQELLTSKATEEDSIWQQKNQENVENPKTNQTKNNDN